MGIDQFAGISRNHAVCQRSDNGKWQPCLELVFHVSRPKREFVGTRLVASVEVDAFRVNLHSVKDLREIIEYLKECDREMVASEGRAEAINGTPHVEDKNARDE